MARRMHIRPRLVHRSMDLESRRVGRTASIAAHDVPFIVQKDHVARFQKAEVAPQRIRPEVVRVLGVADGDVPAHALCEALSGEDAEGAGHVFEDPGAVFIVVGEGWDAGERYALGDRLQRSLALDVLGLGGDDQGLIVVMVFWG